MNNLPDAVRFELTRHYPPVHRHRLAATRREAIELARRQLAALFRRHPAGFVMFMAPQPGHPEYRAGQSWVERLDVGEDLVRHALDEAGVVRHKSLTALAVAPNKFVDASGVERPYASVYERLRGITRYFRNPRLA
jgi:hypothetical protein